VSSLIESVAGSSFLESGLDSINDQFAITVADLYLGFKSDFFQEGAASGDGLRVDLRSAI